MDKVVDHGDKQRAEKGCTIQMYFLPFIHFARIPDKGRTDRHPSDLPRMPQNWLDTICGQLWVSHWDRGIPDVSAAGEVIEAGTRLRSLGVSCYVSGGPGKRSLKGVRECWRPLLHPKALGSSQKTLQRTGGGPEPRGLQT